MTEYAVTEQANGDLTVHVPEGDCIIPARREQPSTEARVVGAEVAYYTSPSQGDTILVMHLHYRWPDGYEKWGGYLGYTCKLVPT